VHRLGSGGHPAAEGLADSLMPEAHAEQRHGDSVNDCPADAKVGVSIRAAWPRRDHDAVEPGQLLGSPAGIVVAHHRRVGAGDPRQALHQVVGERIIVVDDKGADSQAYPTVQYSLTLPLQV
jgi:hypothetical protein